MPSSKLVACDDGPSDGSSSGWPEPLEPAISSSRRAISDTVEGRSPHATLLKPNNCRLTWFCYVLCYVFCCAFCGVFCGAFCSVFYYVFCNAVFCYVFCFAFCGAFCGAFCLAMRSAVRFLRCALATSATITATTTTAEPYLLRRDRCTAHSKCWAMGLARCR